MCPSGNSKSHRLFLLHIFSNPKFKITVAVICTPATGWGSGCCPSVGFWMLATLREGIQRDRILFQTEDELRWCIKGQYGIIMKLFELWIMQSYKNSIRSTLNKPIQSHVNNCFHRLNSAPHDLFIRYTCTVWFNSQPGMLVLQGLFLQLPGVTCEGCGSKVRWIICLWIFWVDGDLSMWHMATFTAAAQVHITRR